MESYTLEEKVLRKVMRNIPMGLIVSKEGFRRKIYYVNDTACEIMGYTREEYIRKMQDGWTDLMDVDLREVIREHNEQIRSGTPFEVLSRPQTKNGGYKWILSRVNVQMQEGPLCYVSFMDVTDRMEREELCRQENEVLREQAMQDSFTKLLTAARWRSMSARRFRREAAMRRMHSFFWMSIILSRSMTFTVTESGI